MASLDSVRIALKPMSRMSLNERFQLLRQKQAQVQTNAHNGNKLIQNASRLQLRQGSQKNRRLALQMANRPSVLAALRPNQSPPQKNRSVKQRLGMKRMSNKLMAANPNRIQNQNRTGFRLNRTFNSNRNLNNRNNALNYNNYNTNRRNANNINTEAIGVIVGVRRKGICMKKESSLLCLLQCLFQFLRPSKKPFATKCETDFKYDRT